MARIVKLALARTVLVALGMVSAMCVASTARAAHVTAVSLSGGSMVGNSNRTVTATITVAFEPNENLFFDGECCITSVFASISGPGLFGNSPACGDYVPICASSVKCTISSEALLRRLTMRTIRDRYQAYSQNFELGALQGDCL